MKAVLLSYHYMRSRRRAGMHFMAGALAQAGWNVEFVTVNVSRLKRWRDNPMFRQEGFIANLGRVVTGTGGIESRILYGNVSIGATGNRALDAVVGAIAVPWYQWQYREQLAAALEGCTLVILESTPAVLLWEDVRKLAPQAKTIYRCSDDLEFYCPLPAVLRAEKRVLSEADLVSTVSQPLCLQLLARGARAVSVHRHGVDAAGFAAATATPYVPGTRNLVFVGSNLLDDEFLRLASTQFPDVQFHIIGPLARKFAAENLVYYGEMDHRALLPYLKYADAGLHTLSRVAHAEVFSDSNKVMQYRYSRLPVIAPEWIAAAATPGCSYTHTRESVRAAVQCALQYDRNRLRADGIISWDATLAAMLADLPKKSMA